MESISRSLAKFVSGVISSASNPETSEIIDYNLFFNIIDHSLLSSSVYIFL